MNNRKTKRTYISISLIVAAAVIMAAPALASDGEFTKKEVKQQLDQQNASMISVEQLSETYDDTGTLQHIPVRTSVGTTLYLEKQSVVGMDPIMEIGQQPGSDILYIAGITKPLAQVSILADRDFEVDTVQADEEGQWHALISSEELPEGAHSLYVRTSVDGVDSTPVEVATIEVVSQPLITNATWLLIIIVGCAILSVLIAINLQFFFHRRSKEKFISPPAAHTI
ncbi:MAG: hypothetical protein ABIG66_00830 [Candidatus Kerfeldbacteria bacterium]